MTPNEITLLFDQQASHYNQQWSRLAPVSAGLHFFLNAIFKPLPAQAKILCVGVGTGKELIYLAEQFPDWTFTALDPSAAMLDVCQKTVAEAGFSARCYFHHGYLDSLPMAQQHHGATCFLVSQFILEPQARTAFFQQIANQLHPNGILVSSDLAADTDSLTYDQQLDFWLSVMSYAALSDDDITRMKTAYAKDVAVLAPTKIASIIQAGGFARPIQFYQAGMVHAFFAHLASMKD